MMTSGARKSVEKPWLYREPRRLIEHEGLSLTKVSDEIF